MIRSSVRAVVLCVLGLLASAPSLRADEYPSRPVRWIVAFPPGGSTDVLARIMGEYLQRKLGQPFLIDNRPGAGNNIGTEMVVKAAPDGYTLLLVNPANAINTTLYRRLNFDFIRDILPVGGFVRVPNMMEVNPDVPARTVAEFIAYARANPGKVNMASSGIGTSIHLSGELFMAMTGVKMTHVPYRGSAPALTDLIGGQVQVLFDNLPSSVEHIRAGKLRPLAVTTERRSDAFPDVPTVGETVPGYEASAWFGMGVPKGTPRPIIDRLNAVINEALADPAMQKRLADLGGTPIAGTPEEFGRIVAEETEKWRKVIGSAGIKID